MNLGILCELGNTIKELAATAGIDNRLAPTFTLVDTGSPPTATYTVTSVDAAGTTRTWKVG